MANADIEGQRAKIFAKIEARRKKEGGGSGGVAVHMGDDTPSVARISTGSHQLDYATTGGIPIGRWSRFFGGRSSGKSLTIWNTARNAQAMGLTCLYANVEKQYDPDYTMACGVDIDSLIVLEGTVIESVGQDLDDLMPVVDVIFIDSCSEGIAASEAAGEYGDQFYAAKARAWNSVFLKLQTKFDHTRHTIVYTDHVRDTFGSDQVHPPGGKLMEHRSSMTLYFRQGGWLFRNSKGRLVEEGDLPSLSGYKEADGIETQVRVEKSRVGRPFRMARMHYDLDNASLDLGWELAAMGKFLDEDGRPANRSGKPPVITKTTPSSSYYNVPGTDKTVQGEHAVAQVIDDNPDVRDALIAIIKKGYTK